MAWKGKDLLAQVLQLRPAEEDQVVAMIRGYTSVSVLLDDCCCTSSYVHAARPRTDVTHTPLAHAHTHTRSSSRGR